MIGIDTDDFEFHFVPTTEQFDGTLLDPHMGWLCKDVRNLIGCYLLTNDFGQDERGAVWSHGPHLQFTLLNRDANANPFSDEFDAVATLRQRTLSITLIVPRPPCGYLDEQFVVEVAQSSGQRLFIARHTQGPGVFVRLGGPRAPLLNVDSLKRWVSVMNDLSPQMPRFVRRKAFFHFCKNTLRRSSFFSTTCVEWLFEDFQSALNRFAELQVPLYCFA